jgi:pimeloyl-ACP methyl ester carboxylesterase
MAEHFKLSKPPTERPLEEWSTIAVELLGCTSRIVQGKKYYHHILEKGEGPALFLYHGIGGHVETYARTLPALAAAGYHVIAAEALFHGYSYKGDFDRSHMTNLMADGVIDLADAMGIDKFSYEGESMGGTIGVNLGFRYPNRINKMILNGFAQFNTDKEFKVNPSRGNLFELSHACVADPSYQNIRARLEWLVAVPERINDEMVAIRQRLYQDPVVNASMRKVYGMDDPNMVPGVGQAPYEETDFKNFEPGPRTLVLWGEWNPGRGYDYAEYCADLIGGKFYGVDDSGHWPQWEHPDEYVQVLTEFLKS